jgi:tight adherence protein C
MNTGFSWFADGSVTMLGVLVFLATTMLSFAIMRSARVHGSVKRRAAGIAGDDGDRNAGTRGLRSSGFMVAQKLIEFTQQHYVSADSKEMKVLRQRLIQAGIYDSRAVAYFLLTRVGLAVVLSAAVILFLPREYGGSVYWALVVVAGVAGYLAPNFFLSRRIRNRQAEHQVGFPDFMDLLVVCADSGLSMEASLDRVGRELVDSYPSLSANIYMANLEIRAGRTMTDALEHLGDRLGLEEARSFSTLIAQSEELGSSVTEALRVYSDDMRHKRLSRAEEKAYSLPAKLSLPLMMFIFPVLFVVILLPVVVRLKTGNWG